jgi:hypothetical protein
MYQSINTCEVSEIRSAGAHKMPDKAQLDWRTTAKEEKGAEEGAEEGVE